MEPFFLATISCSVAATPGWLEAQWGKQLNGLTWERRVQFTFITLPLWSYEFMTKVHGKKTSYLTHPQNLIGLGPNHQPAFARDERALDRSWRIIVWFALLFGGRWEGKHYSYDLRTSCDWLMLRKSMSERGGSRCHTHDSTQDSGVCVLQWRAQTFWRSGAKRRAFKCAFWLPRGHFSTCFGSQEGTLAHFFGS